MKSLNDIEIAQDNIRDESILVTKARSLLDDHPNSRTFIEDLTQAIVWSPNGALLAIARSTGSVHVRVVASGGDNAQADRRAQEAIILDHVSTQRLRDHTLKPTL